MSRYVVGLDFVFDFASRVFYTLGTLDVFCALAIPSPPSMRALSHEGYKTQMVRNI